MDDKIARAFFTAVAVPLESSVVPPFLTEHSAVLPECSAVPYRSSRRNSDYLFDGGNNYSSSEYRICTTRA